MGWLVQFSREWGDVASVIGVLVSLVGFAITIYALLRSKSAAEQAALAVDEVREKIGLREAIADLSSVVNEVDEIKQIHRAEVWSILPPRYTAVKRHLAAIQIANSNLSRREKGAIQGVIQQFTELEHIIEAALAAKRPPEDTPSLNAVVSQQADKLHTILVCAQRNVGG